MIHLKITLQDIDPPIWRRLIVSPKTTLLELHDLIQYSFGWQDAHLFIFEIGPMAFVNPPDWEEDAVKYQSAELGVLGELIAKFIPEGGSFTYVYDLGDNWVHEILVEKAQLAKENIKVPVCVSGSRACPPENIGGTYGYDRFLEYLKDPRAKFMEGLITPEPIDFDPENFDLKAINQGLRDHIKLQKLRRASSWETRVNFFSPIDDFSSAWTKRLSPEDKRYAEALPFRRDLVSMLTYLQENKVKGTKALGNFPRDHIRGITAKFVNPPELDMHFGDQVYKLQTEDEVPDLVFMHHYANATGLILGGEDLIWQVSFLGEMFLNHQPENQVWFLTKNWFLWFNWYYLYRFDNFDLLMDLNDFQKIIINLMSNYPSQKPLDFDKFIQDIERIEPNWIVFTADYRIKEKKEDFLLDVVIEPFEKFGLIETVKERSKYLSDYFEIKQIVTTAFGKSLIKYFL